MVSSAVSEGSDYSIAAVSEALSEWTLGALALLGEERDVKILNLRLGLVDGKKRTLEAVGLRLGITRERVRQIQRRALANLSRSAQDDYADATIRCARWLEAFGDRAGERPLSEDLAGALSHFAGGAARAKIGLLRMVLKGVHSSAPRQATLWKDAAALPLFNGARYAERKSLSEVDSRVIVALMQSASSVPLDKLDSSIRRAPETREALADWPNLDLRLRIELMLGVRVDREGQCSMTERTLQGLSKRAYRLNALTSVIRQAGKPLHYKVISKRVHPLLPSRFAMSDRNVHAWMDRYKDRFKWAGAGIYGLAEWDIGVHDSNLAKHLKPARRTGIGDEIALMLTERGEPITMDEIEERILRRFVVNRTSISASVSQDKARRFKSLEGGKVALSTWED